LRTSSGYSLESIARTLNVPTKEIGEIEEGTRQISFREIEKLARLYQRPLTAFFSDRVPEIPTIRDYRINRQKQLSPKVFLAERRAYYLASRITEIVDEKSRIPEFPGITSAVKLASEFRKYLLHELKVESKPDKLLSWYKKLLEEKLRIIIMEYELNSDDVRAFSLLTNVSVIVLNEKDQAPIKLFSLLHEVCHLIKRQAGVCSIDLKEAEKSQIERFCDIFASEFLVPDEDLDRAIRLYSAPISYENVKSLSNQFGVSRRMMAIKLAQRRYMKPISEDYEARITEEEVTKKRMKTGKASGKNWHRVYRNRLGGLALREIESAYSDGKITYSEALDIMDLTSKYAKELLGI
jgi:Zn-dependent peptidase ImmA (M78 family)